MDKLLVIGVSGLLGGRAVELGNGRYVVYGAYNTHEIKGGNFLQLDVTKKQDVFRVIKKLKPDVVIDTHSATNVDSCETNPEQAWLINVYGTKNVAEACKAFGSKHIFLSSDYVFDGHKTTKYDEKDETRPLNYYGKTKLIAEKVIGIIDPEYVIARTAVLYGKGGFGKVSFPLWVANKLKNKQQIKVVVDQYNNPTFVDNLVDILFSLWENDARGLFHVVGTNCINRYELAKLTAEIFSLDSQLITPVKTTALTQAAKRPKKVSLNTAKVERITKIKPIGIREGLQILKEQLG